MDGDTQRLQSVSRLAFIWDESYLWGLMAYKALKTIGLPFDLILAEDVRAGKLADYRAMFVPGGWASNKIKALGEEGCNRIRAFVRDGGNYLGLCGGAGLATLDGIGLLPLGRRPSKERVPSFSGRISLDLTDHPIWKGLGCMADTPDRDNRVSGAAASQCAAVFHAWWPSQFVIQGEAIRVLATYGAALPDAFSSDLNVGDVESIGGWESLEKTYGIRLDPRRLRNDPAVVEGRYGSGKVVLSLAHFDTPGDLNGSIVLENLWEHVTHDKRESSAVGTRAARNSAYLSAVHPHDCATESAEQQDGSRCAVTSGMVDAVTGLLSLGMRNFLWFWRNPMLLQWRRGVRGLEYCTLYVLIREIEKCIDMRGLSDTVFRETIEPGLQHIASLLDPFVRKAERLLLLERHAMLHGQITYERCNDPDISSIREELFSTSKSHGGMFKVLISEVDALLYRLLLEKEAMLKETRQSP
jgi:hypothetical protein